MKKLIKYPYIRAKSTLNRVKSQLLLRTFGIKPKRNTLIFNRITPVERDISPELFNSWSESVLK